MRRTRDSWLDTPTPPSCNREVSGLRLFNGEDLHFHERRKSMMEVQRKWLDDQIKDLNDRREKEKQEQRLFELQSFQLNEARKLREDRARQEKKKMNVSARDFNKSMEIETKARKTFEKKDRRLWEREDLQYLERLRSLGPYRNPLRA